MKTIAHLLETAAYNDSIPALKAVHNIAAMESQEATDALVSLLDIPGVVGDTVVQELVKRGPVVAPAVRRWLKADDSEVIERARHVLRKVKVARASSEAAAIAA